MAGLKLFFNGGAWTRAFRLGREACATALLLMGMVFAPTEASDLPPDWVEIGAIRHGGTIEVGLRFSQPMDLSTVTDRLNYSVSGGSLVRLNWLHLNGTVVLVVAPGDPGSGFLLNVVNLRTAGGGLFPNRTFEVAPPSMAWADIGANELGFDSAATPGPGGRIDLIGGGFQLWDRYDEAIFAHEEIEGDFDRKVRVLSQEPSSKHGRAGLMVRESLDLGRRRPADPSDPNLAFSRYLEVHVSPLFAADGSPGFPEHQVNLRLYAGGIGNPRFLPTENPVLRSNAPPLYPDAWLRIQRRGSLFAVFRGNDGVNWIELGRFDFATTTSDGLPTPPMPARLWVGPSYSPELGALNPFTGLRRAFLAEFAGYGPTESPTSQPVLRPRREPDGWWLVWEGGGTLQSSPSLTPPSWRDVAGSSPWRLEPTGARHFFRVRVP